METAIGLVDLVGYALIAVGALGMLAGVGLLAAGVVLGVPIPPNIVSTTFLLGVLLLVVGIAVTLGADILKTKLLESSPQQSAQQIEALALPL